MLRHKAIVLTMIAALAVPAWAGSGSSGPSKPEDSGKPDDRNQGASNNSGPSKPEDNGKPDDRNRGSNNSGPSKPEDNGKPDDRNRDINPAPNSPTGQDNVSRHSLTATPAGQSVGASGFFETRVRGERERFKVEIDADPPDGATFLVLVNDHAVGTIVLKMQEGELELDTNDDKVLPAGVHPVNAIRSVKVLAPNGMVALEGRL